MAKSTAEIGRRLDALHAALGVSQADVCRTIGLSSGRYSQYVSGKRKLTLEVATSLVSAYGVTLDWLFLGDASALPQHLHKKLQRAA
jgi:transcriptional regulator with XRE-family HTH domain